MAHRYDKATSSVATRRFRIDLAGGEMLWVLSAPYQSATAGLEVLTPGEQKVVELLRQGLSNTSIANARKTSVNTVANQLKSIYRKLSCNSRGELLSQLHGARDEA